jgi:hypothetical protein
MSSAAAMDQNSASALNHTFGLLISTINYALENYGGETYSSIQEPEVQNEIKALAMNTQRQVVELSHKIGRGSRLHRRGLILPIVVIGLNLVLLFIGFLATTIFESMTAKVNL